jgi:hypothetical protein
MAGVGMATQPIATRADADSDPDLIEGARVAGFTVVKA